MSRAKIPLILTAKHCFSAPLPGANKGDENTFAYKSGQMGEACPVPRSFAYMGSFEV